MEANVSCNNPVYGLNDPSLSGNDHVQGKCDCFRTILDTVEESLLVLDSDLRIIYANRSFCDLFATTPNEKEVTSLFELRNIQWNESESKALKHLLEDIFKNGSSIKNFKAVNVADSRMAELVIHARGLGAGTRNNKYVLLTVKIITNSEKRENAAFMPHEHYFEMIEKGNDGIVILQNGKFRFANKKFTELTGYSRKELLNTDFMGHVPKTYRRMISKRFKKVLKDMHGPHRNNEMELLTISGDVMPAEVSFSYVVHRSRPSIMLNIRDITERKHAERQLEISKEKYSMLVEKSNDGIVIVQDCMLKFSNSKFSELTGYSREELLNRKLLDHVPETYQRMVSKRFKKVLKDMRSLRRSSEVEFNTKKGSLLPAEIGLSFIHHEGEPSVMMSVRDISERKRAEKKLRDSEKKYSTLVEKSNDGIIIVQDDILVFANMKFCEITGFSKEEILRRSFEDFLPLDYRQVILRRFRKSLEKNRETPLKYEIELLSKEGINTPAEINSSIIEHESKPAIMAILRDITDQKNKEKKLLELLEVQKVMETVIKSSPAVVFFWRPEDDWRVDFVSENISQFGYDANDLISGKILYGDIVHPSDLERFTTEPEIWAKGVENLSYEYRILTRSGEIRWVDERSVIKRDGEGNIEYIQGIIVDITERKNVQNFMHIVSDPGTFFSPMGDPGDIFYQLLELTTGMENLDCGALYLIDEPTGDMNIVAHKGFSSRFVKSTRHYASNSVHARLLMTDYPLYTRYYELNSMIPGSNLSYEGLEATVIIPIKHKEELVAVLMLASHSAYEIPFSTRNSLETVTAQIGPVIGRMREQADAVKDLHGLQVIFDTIEDLVFMVDDDGCILYVNPFACRLLGYSEDELKGMNLLNLHPQKKLLEAASMLADVIAGKVPLYDIPFETRSGTMVPVGTKCTKGHLGGGEVVILLSRIA
ncbi:PAS domain S-box protein [Methanolobus halotolerans]|uniref:histidine kinase n=1 Tax=Methanolobus halotolerans TaxID=2052935 RepID=A0A4E0QQ02_9EURY|nr:PAS domain S-box protein [Methanolobus halotolerans]TGC06740.1 PAS domain S-box [Methanolobus halotolerans]